MEALYQVSTEREELYICRLMEGLRVPLLVQPVYIEDGVPTESDIAVKVRVLKGGRSGGLPGMSAEDLKGWLREATQKNYPVRRQWELVVRIVQRKFGDGTPQEDLT